jgi:uncharacterized protein GlcG (DUF336 family)
VTTVRAGGGRPSLPPHGRRRPATSLSTQPGGDNWGGSSIDPRIVYAGGIPLLVDGELVGAIGASGGTAAEDEECVMAAASALGFD